MGDYINVSDIKQIKNYLMIMVGGRGPARRKGVFEMRIGCAVCRECKAEALAVDMISGLCPACASLRVEKLAGLQREYQAAVDAGDASASVRVAEIIAEYEQRERVRLKAARRAGVLHAGV